LFLSSKSSHPEETALHRRGLLLLLQRSKLLLWLRLLVLLLHTKVRRAALRVVERRCGGKLEMNHFCGETFH
jgi:hypothetical protein